MPLQNNTLDLVERAGTEEQEGKTHRHAVKRQHGFFAGNARIAVLPAATGAELGAFLTGCTRAA